MPCCKLWPVDEKQAYVDSTHLNNSDELSRIIYGVDKIHNHLLINYHFDWNVRFTFIWNFFKALFEHLPRTRIAVKTHKWRGNVVS